MMMVAAMVKVLMMLLRMAAVCVTIMATVLLPTCCDMAVCVGNMQRVGVKLNQGIVIIIGCAACAGRTTL